MSDDDKVSLKEFIERILDEREKALKRTEDSLKERLAMLNNLRAEVLSDREQYLKKEVHQKMYESAVQRIEAVERWQARMVGMGVVLMLGAGVLGAVIQHLFKP